MLNLLQISLEAHNPDKNYHRGYKVVVGQDLFSEWVVTVWHGRVGCAGRQIHYRAGSIDDARRIVRQKLQRRLSSRRRIACDYQLKRLSSVPELEVQAWLPEKLLPVT